MASAPEVMSAVHGLGAGSPAQRLLGEIIYMEHKAGVGLTKEKEIQAHEEAKVEIREKLATAKLPKADSDKIQYVLDALPGFDPATRESLLRTIEQDIGFGSFQPPVVGQPALTVEQRLTKLEAAVFGNQVKAEEPEAKSHTKGKAAAKGSEKETVN